MDCTEIGNLIRHLRCEKGLTQVGLAEKIGVSDKAVSKWERGLGCPDVSLLGELAETLGVNIETLLGGDLLRSDFVGGNMKRVKFYVCPVCGNLSVCTGNAAVSCCSRTLTPLEAIKATPENRLTTEIMGDEWFIISRHPMEKENYISFVALLTGESVRIFKQYPEWELQLHMPAACRGRLLWYSTTQGLLYTELKKERGKQDDRRNA